MGFIIYLGTIFQVNSKWANVILETSYSRWSQASILLPLPLLVYIKDLTNELKSSAKLFADDTLIFIIIKDKNESANTLNNDLLLIS